MFKTRPSEGQTVSEPQTLAEWVRAEMKKRHLTSGRALARYAGLSPDTVSRLLRGVRPEPETIWKLADYFKVSRSMLVAMAGYDASPDDDRRLRSLFAQGGFADLSPEEQIEVERKLEIIFHEVIEEIRARRGE